MVVGGMWEGGKAERQRLRSPMMMRVQRRGEGRVEAKGGGLGGVLFKVERHLKKSTSSLLFFFINF